MEVPDVSAHNINNSVLMQQRGAFIVGFPCVNGIPAPSPPSQFHHASFCPLVTTFLFSGIIPKSAKVQGR
jgi:hypothetical protein